MLSALSLFSTCRLRFLEQENQGQASAKNAGIKLAQGDYLFFLDDDILLQPPGRDARGQRPVCEHELVTDRRSNLAHGDADPVEVAGVPPFENIVARHGATVLRVARAVLGHADADDAWSETFLSAMKAYPDLPDDANVEAWLVTIAHRKAINIIRAVDTPFSELGISISPNTAWVAWR